jgi:branched-chain amino acid aminotransferase
MNVWIDGALVDASKAHVSPFDHALLTGDGVFETLKWYGGRGVFALRRHLERLERSAHGLGLAVPDRSTLERAVVATAEANLDGDDGRVRVTLTGGPAPLGSDRGEARPTLIVAASRTTPWPGTCDVAVCPWPRNERGATAGLKTTSYAENVRALAFAHERGASEAIFANTRDELCEATGSNVFVVRDGRIATPPGSSGCLLGVTRALVLELAAAAGMAVDESPLPIDALGEADEAFLTSTTRQVQPISHVDDRALPSVPGPVAAALGTAFNALVAQDLDP